MAKKVLFIDRDGTLIYEPQDEQIDSFEKLEFLSGAICNLWKIAKNLDFELVMVSNQDGLGTDSFPEAAFWPVQNFIINILKGEGIEFADIFIDKSFPKDNLPTRKPGTAMLAKYLDGNYNLAESYVIGDRSTDIQLAKNLGAKSILVNNTKTDIQPDYIAKDWNSIYEFLRFNERVAEVSRKTNETEIYIKLDLDGTGKCDISTGLGFFDHMLEQIGRHSDSDLTIKVKGDLHVDEHHTIEDTGIALGEAFFKALGNKLGVERYGFVLPMDDCLAKAAIDFGGRNWLVWDVEFKREKIGDMPTEMFYHFFKSFSDSAKANINIKAEGDNEHHKIEAVFKALAKAIKFAKKRDADNLKIPSTKGTL